MQAEPTIEAPTTAEALFGGTEISAIPNPYPVYRRLRAEQPIIPLRTMMGRVSLLVTRYEDVYEVLRNADLFSNRSNTKGIGTVMGRTIVEMDGEEHLKHRNLIKPHLAPSALKGDFVTLVESIANQLIDGFAADGRADLVGSFTFTYPLTVFCQILGLPDADMAQFHHWAIDLTKISREPERGLAGSQALADYLLPVVKRHRGAPTDALLGRLANAEVDGFRLSDDEIVSFLRLLIVAGAETTYHLIGSCLTALLHDREQLEAGVAIDEGRELLLAIGSANRDERHFDDPDRFDMRRAPNDHIGFGFGRHYCAGAKLAQVEARIAMDALLDRLPNLRLDPAAPADTGVVGLSFRGPNQLPVLFDA